MSARITYICTTKIRTLNILEIGANSNDKTEQPIAVFDELRNGKWINAEAIVDNVAVECVTCQQRMPHKKLLGHNQERHGHAQEAKTPTMTARCHSTGKLRFVRITP